MQFFVLRHASHNYEIAHHRYIDKGISEKGRSSLEMVIPQIQEQGIGKLIVSLSPRAQETALALVKLGLFNSFLSVREFNPLTLPEGENWRHFQKRKQESNRSWADLWLSSCWPGLECPANFLLRLERALLRHKKFFEEPSLLIAHEETVWGLNVLLENKDWRSAIQEAVLPGSFHVFEMETV